jgi:CDP-glycerol glycerophosphotransferase
LTSRVGRWLRARRGVDKHLAVYGAYWFRGYSCNPRAIYEKARELAPGIRGVWVVKPGQAADVPDGVEVVHPGTPEYLDVLARAKYFVNNVNFPNEYVKRPGQVHVMTHHGTPLKYMGMDLRSNPVTAAKMDFDALLRRCARWDFSVSSNPLSSEVWAKVYPVEYENLEVGYPRNDVLATATDEAVAAARASLGLAPGKRAVLYAPTHRDWETGHVPVLDLGAAAEALGPDGVLLARAHYFYDADPVARSLDRAGRLLDVAAHPSIETLCLAADVLVTDYSSLMFDYAVLDRPIVIHAPDWERYRDTRGVYFDLMAEPPGVVCRSQDELLDVLRSGAVTTPEADAQRAAFRTRFCALEDGRAAERVVRRVLLGDPEAAAPPAASLA